ncbi:hypothetical protein EDD21DRAFT_116580 [Dissophora ornata]|nr:hypothetical protein EDD21DRAFT_116580 [Dissophora ornata]
MEHKNRFQPYARAAPRRQQPEPAVKAEDSNQIPQVILNIVKKSLNWLGITQEALYPESHTPTGSDYAPSIQEDEAENGETSTGAGAGASHDHAPSLSVAPERLYPDLREYINAKSAPMEEHVLNASGKRPDYDEDEDMRPERLERRLWLRKQLMDSLSNTENKLSASPMANPFLVPATADRSTKSSDFATQSLEKSLASRHDSQEAENVDDDGDLTERELAILGRIRRLTDTPLETSKRKTSTKSDPRLVEEVPVRDPPSPYSAIRRIHQEVEPAPKATPKLLDTILPYNKDYRRQRPTATTRDNNMDHAMHSGDSGSDADESEHATLELRDRRGSGGYRQSRFREKAPDMSQASPERRRRTSRPELQEDLRTSRGGLQIRSQVTPQP